MSDRVIITHPDGRTYSVTPDAHERLYADEGFVVEGEETEASFVAVGIPKPKRVRSKPKAKAAAPVKAPEA